MGIILGWLLDALRFICAFIDYVVYTLNAILLRVIFQLANFELVGFYETFEKRIYVILGIFMLFKVTISMITYLVNPDKISDKEQGMSKVVTRIITVLLMLIMLPTFFGLMTELQNKLLPVIPRVIVGTANTLNDESVYSISENMAVTMLQAFVHKKEGCDGYSIGALDDLLGSINDKCKPLSNEYKFDYLPIVSAVVGIIMVYCLFSMAISVAIRSFKLIILRMIAPIPIISYIDPKSSKDGAFSHWTKTFISTWAELFIHLGMLYFVVYIIDFVLSKDAWKGFFTSVSGNGLASIWDGTMLLAFLFVGLLFFAKSAPQFIFDALGIKSKGNFVRMLGMGATALAVGGNISSQFKARNRYDEQNSTKVHGVRNFGASLFSGLASGFNAGNAILSSDKPNLKIGTDKMFQQNASVLGDINAGIRLSDKGKAGITSLFFGTTPLDDMNRDIENAKAKSTTAKQLKEYAIGEGKKKTASIRTDYQFTDADGNKVTQHISLDDWNQAIAFANSSDGDGYVHFANGTKVAAASSLANKIQGDLEERAGNLYSIGVEAGRAYNDNNTDRINELQAELLSSMNMTTDVFESVFANTTLDEDGNTVLSAKIDDAGALDAFRKSLADSLGVKEVEELVHYHQRDNDGNLLYKKNANGEFELDSNGQRIPVTIDLFNNPSDIKKIEKQNQTVSFSIENSEEYAKAKKLYSKKNK